MSVLSNEQTLVTGSFDHTLEVWDTLSSKNVGTLLGHADRVWCCVALANDWVVSGSFDCTLRVWDVEQARCLSTLKGHRDRVWCVVALSRCRVASGSLDRTSAGLGLCDWNLSRRPRGAFQGGAVRRLIEGRRAGFEWRRPLHQSLGPR